MAIESAKIKYVRSSLEWLSGVTIDECALYSDPALYDALFPNASADGMDEARRTVMLASEHFYVEEARRSGGRVLVLGCGTGRLTVPIARSGVEVIGADLSEAMLERAREKARAAGVDAQFVRADMRRFVLAGLFTAVLIPGNSLLHLLTNGELRGCLGSARRHLRAGGRLIFDISKWNLGLLARQNGERRAVLRYADGERGEVAIEETERYDAAAQVRHIRWHFSAADAADYRTIDYSLRVIFPQELPLLVESCGFRMESRYGEFTREEFGSESARQVCVCVAEK